MLESLTRVLLGLILGITGLYAVMLGAAVWNKNHSYTEKCKHVQEIYLNLVRKTGIGNEIPNLNIVQSPVVNAYATDGRIVLYTGMLDIMENDDEIALVLSHEIAHVALRHVYVEGELTDLDIQHMEANADKLGAFYMMAAGYDLCNARHLWQTMEHQRGDYLGLNHPGYNYRYSQLNVNCEVWYK